MGFCESRSGLLGASLKEICSSNMFESLAAEVSPVSRVEGRGEARSRAERLTESRGGERKKKQVKVVPKWWLHNSGLRLQGSLATSSSARVQLTEVTTVVTHFYHSAPLRLAAVASELHLLKFH